MVLTRALAAVALIAVATTTLEAQRGVFGGGLGSSVGPRPMLFGFALECTRCSAAGRGGRGILGAARGAGPQAVWHFDEYPRIAQVVAGGAAQRAGIRIGDVLLSVDGLSITTDEGSQRFSELRAGDAVHLTLDRAGKSFDADLVLNRGGRGGALVEPPDANAPNFSTHTQGTRVDVWSDARVVQSTDSTGATILRIGNTVVRLTGDASSGFGRGRGRRGGDPPTN